MVIAVRLVLLSLCAALLSAETLPPDVADTVVAQGLSNPSALTVAPDGRVFVGEQPGTVLLIIHGVLQSQPFMTLPADGSSDRGVECILCDPNFTTTHRLYIYFTQLEPAGTSEYNCIWTVDATGNTAGATSQIWQGDPLPQTYCNGGGMVFGPDGDLYVANGDNDTDANAQSMTTTLGKVLRLNSDGSIPSDDPFYGSTTGPEQAIYCLGLRNPYTMAVQPATGLIYLNDVRGTDNDQCVCRVASGANFGYPNNLGATASPPFTAPLIAIPYGNSTTSSHCISGGCFLTAGQKGFPSTDIGLYLFCDYTLGWVWGYNPATAQVSTFALGLNVPIQLAEDPSGDIWYIARGDFSVHELTYTGPGGGTTAATSTTGTATSTAGSSSSSSTTTAGSATSGGSGVTSSSSASSGCGLGASAGLMLAFTLVLVWRASFMRACPAWWLRWPWTGRDEDRDRAC